MQANLMIFFNKFCCFLLNKLLSAFFSLSDTDYRLFLILCQIHKKPILRNTIPGALSICSLTVCKMSHSKAILNMIFLSVYSPLRIKYTAIFSLISLNTVISDHATLLMIEKKLWVSLIVSFFSFSVFIRRN